MPTVATWRGAFPLQIKDPSLGSGSPNRPFPIQSSQDGWEDSDKDLQGTRSDHKNSAPLGIAPPPLEDVLPTVLILDYKDPDLRSSDIVKREAQQTRWPSARLKIDAIVALRKIPRGEARE